MANKIAVLQAQRAREKNKLERLKIEKQIKTYLYHIRRQKAELKKYGIDTPKVYRKKKLIKDNDIFLLKIDGFFYVDILLRLAFLAMDYSIQRMEAYKQGYLKKEPCKIETVKHGYFYSLWLIKKLKKQGMTFRQAVDAVDFRFNLEASRNNIARLKMKPVFLDSLSGHYDFTYKIIGRLERERLYNSLSDNIRRKIKESLQSVGHVPYMEYYKAHSKEKRLLENVAHKLNKENGTTFSYADIISLHSGLSEENVTQSFHYGIQTSKQTVN